MFGPEYAALTIAILSIIAVIAFESMAVSTAMPEVARELDAVRSYALAFSVMLTLQLLGIVLAGVWCDRSGPVPSLVAGQILFALGCGICGASTAFGPFLLGRAVAGLGAGLTFVAGFVVIGRAYPETLRPKVFGVLSAAWVLPSLLGPVLAGWITTTFSWRWVFWVVVVPAAGALAVIVARRRQILGDGADIEPSSRDHREHVRAAWLGLAIAVAAGLMQWGMHDLELRWSPRTVGGLVGLAGVAVCAPLLLPSGTFSMRRGLSSVMLSRFLLPFAFFGTLTYIPLMLTGERGLSLAQAGGLLAVGSIGWSVGSWIQGRDAFAGRRDRLVSSGGAALAVGLLCVVAIAHFGWSPWFVAGALAVCGLGMGLGTASLSVLALSMTPVADHGSASSSLQLADVLGSVIGIAGTGAIFAALHVGRGQDTPVFVTMWLCTAVVASLVIVAGRRIAQR
ncbi:MFS transporter [Knoellia sinensis KCTC 19936]|uniref:MFS transporter n=1 Tax=Knoellia sinensis KCTC 19936 TaxID=1385520 RepID=A0A0A0JC55_9MICO|nr:MFS transporter [Knoellia sinensis KCTC 19936]